MIKQIGDKLIIDYRARGWCKLPYPLHPRGCPNYGRRESCPPQAPTIEQYLDLAKPMWLIAVEFDLANHIKRIKQRHPYWSDRQARCVLYWQAGVNKQLRLATYEFVTSQTGAIYTFCPEAMGVQVIATAQALALPIEEKPINKVFKISLVGYPSKHTIKGIIKKGVNND